MRSVLLAKEFGNNIFTRSSMSDFFKKLNKLKEKDMTLDFKSVEFISRSCADEYIKQKSKSKKKIVEANMSKEVYFMFDVVRKQYAKEKEQVIFTISKAERNLVILR